MRGRIGPAGAIFVGLLVVAVVLLVLGKVFAGGALVALVLLAGVVRGNPRMYLPGSMPGREFVDSQIDLEAPVDPTRGARFDPSEPAVYDEKAWADARAERGEPPESNVPETPF